MKKSMLWIIGSALLCALGMSVLDGVMQPTYAVKSALKITLFLLVPLLYFLRAPEGREQLRNLFTARR
ncbi:MAG: CPBP family intramembrane metalloprotease, partial [Oscillospiraceae bacterium]|nr:CPBP family intramembrane metalloprotease [Oscillospiraceae bacterium]